MCPKSFSYILFLWKIRRDMVATAKSWQMMEWKWSTEMCHTLHPENQLSRPWISSAVQGIYFIGVFTNVEFWWNLHNWPICDSNLIFANILCSIIFKPQDLWTYPEQNGHPRHAFELFVTLKAPKQQKKFNARTKLAHLGICLIPSSILFPIILPGSAKCLG